MTKIAKVTDDLRQRVRSGEWSMEQRPGHFGQRLLENLLATIANPFHFAQEAIPFEFVEGGSTAAFS